jgi:hypothetical protein
VLPLSATASDSILQERGHHLRQAPSNYSILRGNRRYEEVNYIFNSWKIVKTVKVTEYRTGTQTCINILDQRNPTN